MRRTCHQPGYLLIELIAALTLVAIAVAAILPSVAGRSEAARREEVIQRIIDLDRRGRAAALRDGPVVIRAESESRRITLVTISGDTIGMIEPRGIEIYLLDADTRAPLRRITVDRLGRTPDYRVVVRSEGWQTSLLFSGVSGLLWRNSPEGEI